MALRQIRSFVLPRNKALCRNMDTFTQPGLTTILRVLNVLNVQDEMNVMYISCVSLMRCKYLTPLYLSCSWFGTARVSANNETAQCVIHNLQKCIHGSSQARVRKRAFFFFLSTHVLFSGRSQRQVRGTGRGVFLAWGFPCPGMSARRPGKLVAGFCSRRAGLSAAWAGLWSE